MAPSAKTIVLAALPLLLAPAARAEDTKPLPPGSRCEGTLCDLYYGSRPAQPAATTNAAAPASSSSSPTSWFSRSSGPKNAQPVEEPSSTNGYMSVGGGGVLGGGRQERCEGTLCDLYYGSSTKSEAGGAPPGDQRQATAVELPVPHRHIVHESETRPKCAAPAADPWRCLR